MKTDNLGMTQEAFDAWLRLVKPSPDERQDMKIRTPLGRRLRARRIELHLTQERLGELAGTTQAVVQKIENGYSNWPHCLQDLADALNTSPAWLMYGIKSQPGLEDPELCEVAVALDGMSARQRRGIRRALELSLRAQLATKVAAFAA